MHTDLFFAQAPSSTISLELELCYCIWESVPWSIPALTHML